MSEIEGTARRTVLVGLGAAGVATAAAGCGSTTPTTSSTTTTGTTGGGATAGTGGTKVATADIPVGGGKILADIKAVVTQPTKGEFKAFTSVCPHKQCAVGSVENNVITCPCHGSKFDAATGAVTQGPATEGLAAKTVTVSGDQVSIA